MVVGDQNRSEQGRLFSYGSTLLIVLVLLGTSFVGTASAAKKSDQREMKKLQTELASVEARIVERENAILDIDQSLSQIITKKSELERRYTEQLVSAYKDAPSRGVGSLLGVGSVKGVADRLQIGSQIAAYRAKLKAQMAEAGDQVMVGRERRDATANLLLTDQARANTLRRSIKKLAKRAAARKAPPKQIASAPAGSAADLQRQLVNNQTGAGDGGANTGAENSFDTRYWWGPDGKPASPGGNGFLGGFPSPGSIGGGGPVTKASAALIDQYLASKGSPMAGQGFYFVLSGNRYGIDPRLVAAIAGAESSFGKITCADFNAWGWSCPNSPIQFTSWADGIDRVNRGLRIGYLNNGLTSVPQIQQKYAPSNAANDPTGLNNYWVTNVSKFLVEMGGNPANIALAGGGTGDGFGGAGALKPGN
jgi:hypothetical protein